MLFRVGESGAQKVSDAGQIRLAAGEDVPVDALPLAACGVRLVDASESCELRLVGPEVIAAEGPRALRRLRLREPSVPLVALHAPAGAPALVRALFRAGAGDVICVDDAAAELPAAIARLVRRRRTQQAEAQETELLASELGRRARDLESALTQLRHAYDETLSALVAALDMREHETANHSQRVAGYAVLMGLLLGLDEPALERLYRGSMLHDIGKVGTPDAILLKPGSFTPEEWEIMRRHAADGGAILRRIRFLADASDVPQSHHEAWDGRGYPDGLRAEAIPLHARIFAVVDSYDAIRSKRPYKEAFPHADALLMLRKVCGTRLDPALAERFLTEPEDTWAAMAAVAAESQTFRDTLAGARTLAARTVRRVAAPVPASQADDAAAAPSVKARPA
jgi:response regulator RpfG family c-di-GMP phosphodiesterase